MLNRSSSSPVRTGPLSGLSGPPPPADVPDCHGFPLLGLRVMTGTLASGAFELVEFEAVKESIDGCMGREVAAEYDSLESILSKPVPPLPPVPVPIVAFGSGVVVLVGPKPNDSNPLVPGLPSRLPGLPTPLKLGLGPKFAGGGRAWMRE